MNKPPLGLMPQYIWISNRRIAIQDAIERYCEAGMHVPKSWTDELDRLPVED